MTSVGSATLTIVLSTTITSRLTQSTARVHHRRGSAGSGARPVGGRLRARRRCGSVPDGGRSAWRRRHAGPRPECGDAVVRCYYVVIDNEVMTRCQAGPGGPARDGDGGRLRWCHDASTDAESRDPRGGEPDPLAPRAPARSRCGASPPRPGCSTMGIYSRFGGKDGVVDALYAEGFRVPVRRHDRARRRPTTRSPTCAGASCATATSRSPTPRTTW